MKGRRADLTQGAWRRGGAKETNTHTCRAPAGRKFPKSRNRKLQGKKEKGSAWGWGGEPLRKAGGRSLDKGRVKRIVLRLRIKKILWKHLSLRGKEALQDNKPLLGTSKEKGKALG